MRRMPRENYTSKKGRERMNAIKVRDIIANILATESDFGNYNFGVNCNEITIEVEETRKPIVRITITDCGVSE